MKKALITGILGQDGPYLAKLLLDKGYKVYGLMRQLNNPDFSNTDYLGITNQIQFVFGDLNEKYSLVNIISSIKPDEVYNLASQSAPADSWNRAAQTTEVNALGTLYLLEALHQFAPKAKFYQASTSEMFGNSSNNGIQTEDTPLHPRSPYAISKLYAYWITNNFKESYGMFCVNGIMFNHESPLRNLKFVTRKITDGVARIHHGLSKEIYLGNLDSKRDWGFAGDYVEAMHLMLQADKPENYIVSTGKNHTIREFLDAAFKCIGINDWSDYVKIDPKFNRPVELLTLTGSSDKIQQKLGWKPKMQFEELVKTMVDADLKRIDKIKK